MKFGAVLLIALAALPAAARPQAASETADTGPAPVLTATVVNRYPHDPTAFTEGLLWRDGFLYESVGREGMSDVRRVRLDDGKVLARRVIAADQFGEGLAAWDDQLISLTWHQGIAHRWDAKTLKPRGDGRFEGEGWGMTSDGRSLIEDDGSAVLKWFDPRTLKTTRRLTVTLRGKPLREINELEWVDGAILANVWHTPYLVRIDPASGRVTAVVDLRSIVTEIGATDPEAVLNGIAWDSAHRRLFVTGKLWPTLFEVRLEPAGR